MLINSLDGKLENCSQQLSKTNGALATFTDIDSKLTYCCIVIMVFIVAAAALVAIIFLSSYYLLSFWERHGFPYLKPKFFVGNLWATVSGKLSFGLNIYELYSKSKGPFVGVYLFYRPTLLIRDPALIKRILTTDFNSFHDRGVYSRPHEDPISDNLFAMEGQRWRDLRAKFTPTFTSGRLKNMMPTIIEKSDSLRKHLQPLASNGENIELKEWINRFSLDVIASVFFGLEVDTLHDPNHTFRTIERLTGSSYFSEFITMLVFLCPRLLTLLRLPSMPAASKKFVMTLITDQIEQRERDNLVRKDFIQLLIQIRNTGKTNQDESNWEFDSVADDKKTMSIEQCAAQIFLFYVAGFDTSSSAIYFTIFEAANNPDVWKKLREDIDAGLTKHGGQITYESMQDMKYLDLCVKETVRKYPTLPLLNRICTKDYAIPDMDFTIKKGTAIVISLMGTLRDPQNFPDPMLYRPERFSDETPTYNQNAYIPFGDGPRMCIGLRLGQIVAKVGIIQLMRKFNFQKTDPNQSQLDFQSHGVTIVVKGGIRLKISQRTDF